jgi:hypothetical protein
MIAESRTNAIFRELKRQHRQLLESWRYMNQLAFRERNNHQDLTCGDLIKMAELELSAFFRTVTDLFGSEQAEVSAEDWLREVVAIDRLPTSTREWRSITARVLARLVGRVTASSVLAELASA